MQCGFCGALMPQDTPACTQCGRPMIVQAQFIPQQKLGEDLGMRMLLPVGRSVWAILAGYAGLFSVLCLPAPFALLFGVLAVRDIKRHPDRHGMGRAIFGIVMGSLGSVVLVFYIMFFIFLAAKR
jgi:hypothetical protein